LAQETTIKFAAVSSTEQSAKFETKALPFQAIKRCCLKCGMMMYDCSKVNCSVDT
jgi:hypothetical protein